MPLAQWLLDQLITAPAFKLLDAGCGPGAAVKLACEKGAIASGTDVSEKMLKIARERTPQAEFLRADSETLPFENEAFDAVMAVNSLQFTETPANALRDFLRVTKRTGKVGFVVFGVVERTTCGARASAMRKMLPQTPVMEKFSLSPAGRT